MSLDGAPGRAYWHDVAVNSWLLTPGGGSMPVQRYPNGDPVPRREETPEQREVRAACDAQRKRELAVKAAREEGERRAKIKAEWNNTEAFEARCRRLFPGPQIEEILARRQERVLAQMLALDA